MIDRWVSIQIRSILLLIIDPDSSSPKIQIEQGPRRDPDPVLESYRPFINKLVEKANGNVEKALEGIRGGVEIIKYDKNRLKDLVYIDRYEYDGFEVFLLLEGKQGGRFCAIKQPQLKDMNA